MRQAIRTARAPVMIVEPGTAAATAPPFLVALGRLEVVLVEFVEFVDLRVAVTWVL